LVNAFFDRMGSDARFATIWAMHPDDKEVSRDKLARFLCGWLGGPRLYNEKYGAIGIPRVHAHLAIATPERDQWLSCMTESVAEQTFSLEFKHYLMEQLFVPAEAVRRRCAAVAVSS
jgi:hemoglobin